MQKCPLQFSELNALPYYEYQWLLDDVLELIKTEEEARKGDGDSQSSTHKSIKAQQDAYMRKAKSMMPTSLPMPKFNNNFELPKF